MISNFIGWLVVGFIMIYALQKTDVLLHGSKDITGHAYSWRYLIGPCLYLGVIVFNLSITFYIGERGLGWAGIFITLLPALLVFSITRMKLSQGNMDGALAAHLYDFPRAIIPALGRKVE